MCADILCEILEGKLKVKTLLKWLLNQKLEDDSFIGIKERNVIQGDFISYFLNYIHDVQKSTNKTEESITETVVVNGSKGQNLENKEISENILKTPVIKRQSPKTFSKNLSSNLASPISPLYRSQCFTSENDKCSLNVKSHSNICFGDFVTNKKALLKKKVQRSLNENFHGQNEEENYNFKGNKIIRNVMSPNKIDANFKRTDNYCVESKSEIMGLNKVHSQVLAEGSTNVIPTTVSSLSKTTIVKRKHEIIPELQFVTRQEKLDMIIKIYSFLIENSFVRNLTSELHFVVSLLLEKMYNNEDVVSNEKKINFMLLKSIHNRVYFACGVLQNLLGLLKMLDKATLRLLCENKRLQKFATPKFIKKLTSLYDEKTETAIETGVDLQCSVYFTCDTDNRDNFPNIISFHTFRKQRDLFYELLRIWENNHTNTKWSFVIALGGRIKALLNMTTEPANFVHFARLFKAQLLMNTCVKNDDNVNESELTFLTTLSNISADKFQRLKSRISTQGSNSATSVPSFNGYQEFYREFLVVSANHVFNKHLGDALVTEILELNNSKFNQHDLDDLHVETQKSYLSCIKTLRILAKFLGYLESLPYKTDCNQLSQNVLVNQIQVRNKVQPIIHLQGLLQNSIENRSTTLTIPWVIEYMAMLDYVTLRLETYKEVIYLLFEIYHFYGNEEKIYKSTNYFLKLCLGWLFELTNFPEVLYYTWLTDACLSSHEFKLKSDTETQNKDKILFLDEVDIVTQSVLNICCPYLQEIKKLLLSDATHNNNSNATIKHIKPLTTVRSSNDVTSKRVQNQLEEAFFNIQPVSIRKTVDFISERVASACVKEICYEVVPVYKTDTMLDFRESIESACLTENSNNISHILSIVMNNSSDLLRTTLENLHIKIDKHINSTINSRIPVAMEVLLAADILRQSKDVCISIASKNCKERVQQWINSHVNADIFVKELETEIKKLNLYKSKTNKNKPIFALPLLGKNVNHNLLALSGVDLVKEIRSVSWMVLEQPVEITSKLLVNLLDNVSQTITERCDLNDCILLLINRMLLDLTILLISHRFDLIENFMIRCCSLWKNNLNEDIFQSVICPKNIAVIPLSKNEAWYHFGQFIIMLLNEELLASSAFYLQCIKVLKQINHKERLRNLSSCLRYIVKDSIKTESNLSDFTSLTEYLYKVDVE